MIVFLNIHYVLHAGLENLSELLSELQVSDFFSFSMKPFNLLNYSIFAAATIIEIFKLVTLMVLILPSLAIEF